MILFSLFCLSAAFGLAIGEAGSFVDLEGIANSDYVLIDTRDTVDPAGWGFHPESMEELEDYIELVAEYKGGSLVSVGSPSGRKLVEQCGDRQAIFLDFPILDDFYPIEIPSGEIVPVPRIFIYTDENKEEIKRRLTDDFMGLKVDFYLEKPAGISEDCISTIQFACGREPACFSFINGVLLGRADGIDFLNLVRNDSAFVDVSYYEFLATYVYSTDEFEEFFGASLETVVINAAANLAAHELGHNSGLRHYDSVSRAAAFDSYVVPGLSPYVVAVPTDFSGTETVLRLMATFSLGSSEFDLGVRDTFFSERSLIKLVLAYGLEGGAGSAGTAKQIVMTEEEAKKKVIVPKNIILPNTVKEGTFEGGAKLQVRASVIQGSLSLNGKVLPFDEIIDIDTYLFRFKKGEFVTAEGISFASTRTVEEIVISAVKITRLSTNEVLCASFQEFEAFDGLCLDVKIPQDDIYEINILTIAKLCIPDGCFLLGPEDSIFLEGTYDLFVYSTNKALGKPV